MKLSEFCAVMAVNIEEGKGLPQYDFYGFIRDASGLCKVFSQSKLAELISVTEQRALEGLLHEMFEGNKRESFFWPPRQWKPRVIALQLMAEHFAERGR